jgi:hypothetical protein
MAIQPVSNQAENSHGNMTGVKPSSKQSWQYDRCLTGWKTTSSALDTVKRGNIVVKLQFN